MIVTFFGFIFLAANLPVAKCAGNDNLKGNDDIALRNIFVGGLSFDTTDKSLCKYFGQFGEVQEAMIIKDRDSQKSKGYGFVLMKDPNGAENALEKANQKIDGRLVRMNLAAKPENKKHLSARLNSMNHSQHIQDKMYSNPYQNIIVGPRAKANLSYLGKNPRKNLNLATQSKSNQLPQLEAHNKHIGTEVLHLQKSATSVVPSTQSSNHFVSSSLSHLATPYTPQTLNLENSADPVVPHIQPGIPAVPSALSHSATPYIPQTLHWSRSATSVLTHIQPGIPVVPLVPLAHAEAQHYTSQNLLWPRSATPIVPLIQPIIHPMNLPPLASAEVNRQIQNNQMSQEIRKSSMSMNQPTLNPSFANEVKPSRTKVRISNPSIIESKHTPTVDQASGTTSHVNPTALNKDLSEEYSVNNNEQRDPQKNIYFGKIDFTKYTEKNGAPKKSNASNIKQKAEFIASKKSDWSTLVSESSLTSKIKDKKVHWADSVEENDEKRKI